MVKIFISGLKMARERMLCNILSWCDREVTLSQVQKCLHFLSVPTPDSILICGAHFLHEGKKMHAAFSHHPSGLLSKLPMPAEMGAPVFFFL